MYDLPMETAAIMPLIESRRELDGTAAVLRSLWDQRHNINDVATRLANQSLKHVILVGSGDSLVVAELIARDMERLLAIPCRAYQAYEFINDSEYLLNPFCLVIVISASGRPSPVTEALKVAVSSAATVIGITNQAGNVFSELPDYCLLTGAVKQGIPTQSTSAALFLLSLLAIDIAFCCQRLTAQSYNEMIDSLRLVTEQLPQIQASGRNYWERQDRSSFFDKRIIFLATGSCSGIAPLAANLLACGPQIASEYFLLEEYHHSLRLLQANSSQLFMIFIPKSADNSFALKTAEQLEKMDADVLIVSSDNYALTNENSALSDSTSSLSLINVNRNVNFYHLVFLQELSLRLAKDFIDKGGIRVTFNKG